MNERHLQLCASAEWSDTVRNEILPWALHGRDLGDDVLEVGPGPGRTTDVLRHTTAHLTAVEVDLALAQALAERLVGSNVDVVHADGTALPFEDGRFSGATSFTMLHHVPSAAQQDVLLAELRRVLRPGGLLVGVDTIDSSWFRDLHVDDTCVPVDPATLARRLAQAGFVDVDVERSTPEPARRFRFAARAPRLEQDDQPRAGRGARGASGGRTPGA
jgi:SAM-dependent methyltransferase